MKYIIIGLGNFGASLSEKLTGLGNEVIGVDINMAKVEVIKEKISHAICLDATEIAAVSKLPIKETDIVVIGIGENKEANILATALMKQLKVKRLISRAVSPLQKMVLEAMGVEEIIHPEEETAERWAKKLNLRGVIDSFELTVNYSIVETIIPKKFDGQSLIDLELKKNYGIIILTTMNITSDKNELGASRKVNNVQGIATGNTVLREGDIMVLYGSNKDIKKLLDEIK